MEFPMQDDAWLAFSERVSCEDRWRFDCVAVGWPLPAAEAARLAERNAHVLATIAVLEERRADSADEDNPVLQEMARLDAKLTALVDIVNRLLVPADGLPAREPIRFNGVGAVVPAACVPADDGVLLLRLRFDACPSLPLELPARVQRRFDDGRVFLVFAELSDATSDAIERFVFRHHRRKVAESRQSAS
jgi:hypothetical protein